MSNYLIVSIVRYAVIAQILKSVISVIPANVAKIVVIAMDAGSVNHASNANIVISVIIKQINNLCLRMLN